ncbi:hypothetical protein MAPG_09317 [Magnaporthiopsis poae ATCC 64411]|uniref:Uncharacterized protein n=1 Tax=Magnaporthiopsis poae (strain ATCC 64411 / 73-15) TaxID=644358 RepID=A0A0C4E9M1_MAGP6|nr:hypothetical protein MAPG_09317 [Magnaporthiopsis poae ATCC 64411]
MAVAPDGRMRDNLIRAAHALDADALCDDLCGGLYEGFDDCERRGMLVWADPWRVESWEVSEGFCRDATRDLRRHHEVHGTQAVGVVRRQQPPKQLDAREDEQ